MKAVAIGKYTDGERFLAGVLPSDVCIGLDNGHGTRLFTPGKRSADGRYFEGEWARIMTQKLAAALETMGFRPWIVVPEDQDISLYERCRRANAYMTAHPDRYHIYVSIHSNAAPEKSCVKGWCDTASGLTVYCSKSCSEASLMLARNIYGAGVALGCKGNRKTPGAEWPWREDFTVLAGTKMPAVLSENMFHTCHKDVDFLLSEEGQRTVVNYHVAGICKTLGIPYSLCKG